MFGLVGGVVKGIATGDWSTAQNIATSAGLAYVFSGFNPVAAGAAIITTGFLETPAGRDLVKWQAKEWFDDVLGMSPRAAYIASYVTISITLNFAAETAIANLTAEAGKVVDFDPNNPKHMDLIRNEKYGYNSFGDGANSTNPDKAWAGQITSNLKVIEGANGKLALVGSRPYALGSVHTGANSPNFPKALNMKYPTSLPFQKGTTFGFCHQAANATLLKAGFSNVVTQTSGNFSTYVTTFVYGNYGGGLMIKANSVHEAYNNWEKGRQ